MSAQELRAAAALMRSRAEAATPGPWHGTPEDAPSWTRPIVWAGQATVAEVSMPIPPECGLDGLADREHIASWHPTVALAVADWLEAIAEHVESHECEAHCEPDGCDQNKAALTLARAYLGGAS